MSDQLYSLKNIESFKGKEIGVSDWLLIDQEMIDSFAECTNDKQWIHVDVARARNESPFGGTIAHGYLILSLLADFQLQGGILPEDGKQALNYGLDKVRFLSPVLTGSLIRNQMVLQDVQVKEKGVIVKVVNTVEIEGAKGPALVAETIAMLS